MADVKLVEKFFIRPAMQTDRRRIFLSNIDQTLVTYQESVSFFGPPPTQMSFSEAVSSLYQAIGQMLVAYDFLGGRLVPSLEDGDRLEIDCNGAGMVVVAATIDCELSQFGDLMTPKSEFRPLVAFLHEKDEDKMDMKEKPLMLLQLTQFKCGSLALASRYNHCTMDGVAVREFETNLAALSRGDGLVIEPKPDRTMFKARNPPKIDHPHYEYSRPISIDSTFTVRGNSNTTAIVQQRPQNKSHLVYLPADRIASMKKAALKDGVLKNCSIFQVVAAKIWKARSIAVGTPEEETCTVLFPVDVRKRVVPEAPFGFAGNALVPGFARASMSELKGEDDSVLVRKVQEGLERLDDEYVKSGIDWLEVHKGVPCGKNTFSIVAWWRLGLEEAEFAWGRAICATTISVKPGLVILLPEPKGEGGLNICQDLPEDQMEEFRKLMMED
ncbi:acyltransferase GLAUCE-like [Malania oleifera]|uniref:acyltransferase GLAUCE-like n=1 Tax=Malania oleifera TaxID=397392 RepID=UPI0025ADD97A|nr:acyltransferase GLAUCE-like [Malania oleifera]